MVSQATELTSLVLKLSEILSREGEEIELIKADLRVLAESASQNVSKLKERLAKAETALTEEQPKAVSERFSRVEAKLDDVFYRLGSINSKIAKLERKIEEIEQGDETDSKYERAIQTLSGTLSKIPTNSGKLDTSILSELEAD